VGAMMNHVERFRAVMRFEPVDRLPRWEWAMWWDETIARWHTEGLPGHLAHGDVFGISQYFGLDPYIQFWFSTTQSTIEATQHHTEGVVANMDDYRRIRPMLFPDHSRAMNAMRPWAKSQARGDAVVWATLEGFFWLPRTLMDIEKLSYAYYDQPELVHAINHDLLAFNLQVIREMRQVCRPVFITIAEDVSYNHGPMISRGTFEEFMAPYYRGLLDAVKEIDAITIVDTDGDITEMAPWLESLGIDGVLPLERQANVDGNRLREQFPRLCMVGHYDKLVMSMGEDAMRREFERLVPLMRSGGYIPSVDHQTPPEVSLDQYRSFLRLLNEYTEGVGISPPEAKPRRICQTGATHRRREAESHVNVSQDRNQ